MPINIVTSGKVPGHYRRAARRTNSTGNCEAMEIGAFLCQPVNVRRLDVRMPVTAQVTPAPIVGEDKENIWSTFLGANGRSRCEKRQHGARDDDKFLHKMIVLDRLGEFGFLLTRTPVL